VATPRDDALIFLKELNAVTEGDIARVKPVYEIAEKVLRDKARARAAVRFARNQGWTHQHTDVGISTASIASLGVDVALGIEDFESRHDASSSVNRPSPISPIGDSVGIHNNNNGAQASGSRGPSQQSAPSPLGNNDGWIERATKWLKSLTGLVTTTTLLLTAVGALLLKATDLQITSVVEKAVQYLVGGVPPPPPKPDQIADPKPPNWIADSKTGCWMWDPAPVPNQSISWSGQCVNKLAQGHGVLKFFLNGKEMMRVEGEFRGGKLNGRGTQTDPSGDYVGEWRDSKRHGQGVMTSSDGFRAYVGEFRDGNINGQGKATLPDGDWYDGEWQDGMPNGPGKAYIKGHLYQGTWMDGCFRLGDRTASFWRTAAECGFR
jgi:hypothetical protein